LLNALLDISKLEAGSINPDVEDVSVAEIFAALHREFDSRPAPAALRYRSKQPALHQDGPYALRQLLENLLANGIKYTERGSVSLSCLLSDQRPRYHGCGHRNRHCARTAWVDLR